MGVTRYPVDAGGDGAFNVGGFVTRAQVSPHYMVCHGVPASLPVP